MSNRALESCQEWYVYNPQTHDRIGPINTEEFKKYLIKFDTVGQSAMMVWCPFWKDPRRGTDVLELLGNLPAPPPDPTKTIKVIYENSEPFAAKQYPIDRKFPRVPGVLNVTLVAQSHCFRTQTKTLSMGGMGFIELVPQEFFSPNCKAVISTERAPHGIIASLKKVSEKNPDSPVSCVRFDELRGWSLTTYLEWLNHLSSRA